LISIAPYHSQGQRKGRSTPSKNTNTKSNL